MLDVDGVLNANRPGWGAAPRKATAFADGTAWTMRYAPALIGRISTLVKSSAVDVRWSSTWCPHTDQLARVFGLNFPAAFGDRPSNKTWAELKVEAATDVLAAGKSLIWTDDDEVDAARTLFPALANAEADGRALLIAPRSNRGLQPEDLDRIEHFLKGAA